MNLELSQSFAFENQPIRFSGSPDKPLANAADVCRVLGYNNTSMALRRVDEDEKITVTNRDSNPRAGIAHKTTWLTDRSSARLGLHFISVSLRPFNLFRCGNGRHRRYILSPH